MPHEYIQNTLEYVVQKSTSSVVRALYDIDTRFLFWVSDRNRRDKSEFLYKVKKKKKEKSVSCEYDRLNGRNSTLQAAWYIRHVRIICFCTAYDFFAACGTLWFICFIMRVARGLTQNDRFDPLNGLRVVTYQL